MLAFRPEHGTASDGAGVLAAANRLRHARDFQSTIRRGVRAGRRLVAVHIHVDPASSEPPRVGFVVAGSVGGAVVRNTVRRRLRHVLSDRLSSFPAGSRVVVRATPEAACAPSRALADEVDEAVAKAFERIGSRT